MKCFFFLFHFPYFVYRICWCDLICHLISRLQNGKLELSWKWKRMPHYGDQTQILLLKQKKQKKGRRERQGYFLTYYDSKMNP